jgi:hypothetical protein
MMHGQQNITSTYSVLSVISSAASATFLMTRGRTLPLVTPVCQKPEPITVITFRNKEKHFFVTSFVSSWGVDFDMTKLDEAGLSHIRTVTGPFQEMGH